MGSVWSKQILCDLRLFCIIWACSVWSEQFLHYPWRFCVIRDPVLHYLILFCISWAGSAFSGSVLCDLSWSWMFWSCFASSERVLHDLWWYCVIWAASARFKQILRYLWRFWGIWSCSVWSKMVLHNLNVLGINLSGFCIKAHPHLYANANKACGTEANANKCQKDACSAFAAQVNKQAFCWLFVGCPNECTSTSVWWWTYFSLKYRLRQKAFACSLNIRRISEWR